MQTGPVCGCTDLQFVVTIDFWIVSHLKRRGETDCVGPSMSWSKCDPHPPTYMEFCPRGNGVGKLLLGDDEPHHGMCALHGLYCAPRELPASSVTRMQ